MRGIAGGAGHHLVERHAKVHELGHDGREVHELRDAAAKPRLTLPATDATGRATIEGEAQAFTAWVLPKRLQESKAQREFVLARAGQSDPFAEVRLPLGRVAVRVGETTRVELKLPPAWDR